MAVLSSAREELLRRCQAPDPRLETLTMLEPGQFTGLRTAVGMVSDCASRLPRELSLRLRRYWSELALLDRAVMTEDIEDVPSAPGSVGRTMSGFPARGSCSHVYLLAWLRHAPSTYVRLARI